MIYSTNRRDSLGDVFSNENYIGVGSLDFIQECYEDELSIFEAAIKSDMDEHQLLQESSDLTALNEGFVQTVKEQIKKIMQKFMDWIQSMIATVLKKFDQQIAKSATSFAKSAKKKFAKVKGDLVYKGKRIKNDAEMISGIDSLTKLIKTAEANTVGTVTKSNVDKLEKMLTDMDSPKEAVKDGIEDVDVKGSEVTSIFNFHIKLLEDVKYDMNTTRTSLKQAKTAAIKLYKEAKSDYKDADEKDKETASTKLEAVKLYRDFCVKMLSNTMKQMRRYISAAKSVVSSILRQNASKAVDESVDIYLLDMMDEAFDYEMEAVIDSVSEGKKCDDEDDDDSDDDSELED